MKKLIPNINDRFGNLSMLINNASLFEKDNIKFLTPELFDKHININMKAPLFYQRLLKSNTKKEIME